MKCPVHTPYTRVTRVSGDLSFGLLAFLHFVAIFQALFYNS